MDKRKNSVILNNLSYIDRVIGSNYFNLAYYYKSNNLNISWTETEIKLVNALIPIVAILSG